MGFFLNLDESVKKNNSLLCVGLDPDPVLIQPGVCILDFNKAIIDATASLVCAYKPNLAFYEAEGAAGWDMLRQTIEYIPQGIPVIADAKRGDIGNTAKANARAIFDELGAGAVTVNPYLGLDAVKPFLDYPDRGVFVLCRTSNKGAADFQSLKVVSDFAGTPYVPVKTNLAPPLDGSILKSTDGGRHWAPSGTAGQPPTGDTVVAMKTLGTTIYYATGAGGPTPNTLFRSTDGGVTFINMARSPAGNITSIDVVTLAGRNIIEVVTTSDTYYIDEGLRFFTMQRLGTIGREEHPLYQVIAKKASEWNKAKNIGLVVGATYPDELKSLRQAYPEMPFLIPGVGAQGGDLKLAVQYGMDKRGAGIIINSSRQILYASRGQDFAEAARQAALQLRDEINLYRSMS